MLLRIDSSRVQGVLLFVCLFVCVAGAACSDSKRPAGEATDAEAVDDEDAAIELTIDASAVTLPNLPTGTCSPGGQSEFPTDPPDGSTTDSGSCEPLDSATGQQVDSSAVGQDSSIELADAGSQTGTDAGGDSSLTTNDGSVPFCSSGKVDLLFVVDNSGSMAEEQKKLAAVLPQLVTVLTTGHLTPAPAGSAPDFPPIRSLHVGVVSSDLGLNLAPTVTSCGAASFSAVAPDPGNSALSTMPPSNGERLNKPFGDDGLLNISTAVAVAGITARPAGTSFSTPVAVVVPPDSSCSALALSSGERFIQFTAGSSDASVFARQFGCLAKLGRNGCGLEQQLEAMLKALTPSTSSTLFSRSSTGHGNLENRGFLRDDAALVVVVVSDEEDCSIPDSSSELFHAQSTSITEDINIRCGLTKYESLLQPTARYVAGLRALKPAAYADRIVFAGIVGVPMIPGKKTIRGSADLHALLNDPTMVFVPRQMAGSLSLEPTPSCSSANGDGTAAPARRMVQVAEQFGPNGLVTSICEDEYGSAMAAIVERIAVQQQDVCTTGP